MAEKELNWHRKSWFNIGNDFSITVKDPVTGKNGPGVYQIYGVTDEKWQSSISLSEGGLMSIYNDGAIEIHAGAKSQRSVNIQISTTGGDITITAGKTGEVRIRANNITFDCDGTMTMNVGKDLNMKIGGGLGIAANVANLQAQTGNMLPEGESFSEKCFADSHVGSSAVKGYKRITSILS